MLCGPHPPLYSRIALAVRLAYVLPLATALPFRRRSEDVLGLLEDLILAAGRIQHGELKVLSEDGGVGLSEIGCVRSTSLYTPQAPESVRSTTT
jgi:hypothetical protein